jgi:hypothetical protein
LTKQTNKQKKLNKKAEQKLKSWKPRGFFLFSFFFFFFFPSFLSSIELTPTAITAITAVIL